MNDFAARLNSADLAKPTPRLDSEIEQLIRVASLSRAGKRHRSRIIWALPVVLAAGLVMGLLLAQSSAAAKGAPKPAKVVVVEPSPALIRYVAGADVDSRKGPFERVVSKVEISYQAGTQIPPKPGVGEEL